MESSFATASGQKTRPRNTMCHMSSFFGTLDLTAADGRCGFEVRKVQSFTKSPGSRRELKMVRAFRRDDSSRMRNRD